MQFSMNFKHQLSKSTGFLNFPHLSIFGFNKIAIASIRLGR